MIKLKKSTRPKGQDSKQKKIRMTKWRKKTSSMNHFRKISRAQDVAK